MADCFSLPNAAEILKNIRWMYADEYWVQIAADAIEALLAENEKLKSAFDECYAANEDLFRKLEDMKAKLDAFVQLFSKTEVWKCQFCAHNRQPHRTAFADCDVAGECKNTDGLPTHFELRGAQEEHTNV